MRAVFLTLMMISIGCPQGYGQGGIGKPRLDSFQLSRAHMILRAVYDDIKKHYYDPKFHGVNLDEAYAKVDAALDGSATNTEAFLQIAGFADALKDSHTFFIPPNHINHMDRGFQMAVVGEACFVTQTKPKTDAAARLHPGDRILSINGYKANRSSFEVLNYLSQILIPSPTLTVVVADPKGVQRTEIVKASFRQGKDTLDLSGGEGTVDYLHATTEEENFLRRQRQRYSEIGQILVWKVPDFDGSEDSINTMFGKASRHTTLILDLRGNPGGEVVKLKLMLAHVFDHEIKLADRVTRKETKPEMVKAGKWGAYTGKLIVLIDGGSASAAELFARVIQIEHRGTVIGDRSAGAVMEARQYEESIRADTEVPFAISVTSASLIMTDGQSLEKVGVLPDQLALPSANEMALGEDSVLARVVTLEGERMDSATAGQLFPYEWPPN